MVTLEQVKFQCRIEHDDEDALLAGYMAAARDHVQKHLDCTIYELVVPDDDPDGVIDNPSIDQATLLLISHWYAHREAVSESSMTEMPMGTYHLLQPYRNMGI